MSKWLVLSVGSILIAIKMLLISAYVSTDFEVHRNWLAVTYNKQINEWYTEKTSEWTLDYPPFFAYFEYFLANIAKLIGLDEILKISEKPVFSRNILIFQRVSVIFTDLLYIAVCALYSFKSQKLIEKLPVKLRKNGREACFLLLSCLQALLMIDSIHFQYNSMLTSIFILSVYFLDNQEYCKAAFVFSILVNFKHIYVYYALGYVFYYLFNYFDLTAIFSNFPKAINLVISLLFPFIFSITPFLYSGRFQSLIDICARLFPISRGLTHAFWAPNFWALYNFADLILYRVLKLFKVGNFEPPTYTSGLVQEYSHSVLPNVSPLGTLVLVVISSVCVLSAVVIRGKCKDFTIYAVFASLCFFYFGYHVHEKAIILVTVPMTIFAVKDIKYVRHLILISTVASFSLFPLLFTNFEIFLKYSISFTYFLLQLFLVKKFTRVPLSTFLPTRHIVFFLVLLVAEIYNTFLHQLIFGSKFQFAPLMIISLLTSIGVTSFFISLIWSTVVGEAWQIAKCRMREELIKQKLTYSVQSIEYEEDVELVAGIDVSASKTNADFVIVSMSIFSYPDNKHIATFSDSRILEQSYIPQFLAIREAEIVAQFILSVVEANPDIRPDVILCDGFGQFHSRGCGMACHVGALTGIASIGVAKNLSTRDVYDVYGEDKKGIVEKFIENLRKTYTENKGKQGYVPFDIILPCKMNVVRINGNNMSGIFVSAGYGIELDIATSVVIRTLEKSTTCEPIRHADLTSRDMVRRYFD